VRSAKYEAPVELNPGKLIYGLINGNFLSSNGILQVRITCLNSFRCIFNPVFTVSQFGKGLRHFILLHFMCFSFNLGNTNLVR